MANAREESTYAITVAYTDENGDAVTPTAVTWTLMDGAGTVINGRSAVSIATPSTSNTIVLKGDDLAVSDAGQLERVLLIEATYDSSLGSGLPLKKEYRFHVDDLVGVS